MEFITWIILSWEKALFKDGGIFALILLPALISIALLLINKILGFLFIFAAVIFLGLVAYVFISREVKKFYARFEKEKNIS